MVSREDYNAMLADLQEEYHPQTPTEHLLVESLALEFIKLGRVSALEMLVLDWSPAPGCDSVNLLENLHGMTRGQSVEEIESQLTLLEELFTCLRDGAPPGLAPDDAASIADRLWRVICASGDAAAIGAAYGVASQEDVESVLRGKVVPIEHAPAWSAALTRIKGFMDEEYTRVHRAHDELAAIRTASNAVSLRNLPRLSLLGQYSATLQRNINRIIGQLKANAPSRTASCKPIDV